jgi:hypothetical protein
MTLGRVHDTMGAMVTAGHQWDRGGSLRPIGGDLEHDRLRHRERRVQMVLDILRERARTRPAGAVPTGLAEAIRSFEAELEAVRRALTGR